jgi:hypothetical protein
MEALIRAAPPARCNDLGEPPDDDFADHGPRSELSTTTPAEVD